MSFEKFLGYFCRLFLMIFTDIRFICKNGYLGSLCEQEPIFEISVPIVLSSQIGNLLDRNIVTSCPTDASDMIRSGIIHGQTRTPASAES